MPPGHFSEAWALALCLSPGQPHGREGGQEGDGGSVGQFVLLNHKQHFSILNAAPVALHILAINFSYRFLCLKTSRVLSELSKAQVNSVPTCGPSQESEIAILQAPLSFHDLAISTHLLSDMPAESLPDCTSSRTPGGDYEQEPLPQALGTPHVKQPVIAQACPAGSTSGQQPSDPGREVSGTVGQGSSLQKALEDRRLGLKLVVPSPTSPVSG